MSLIISGLTPAVTSVTFLANSVPAEIHADWAYQLNGGTFVLVNSGSTYRENITITGLSENTTYTVRVRAYKGGVAQYSSFSTFTTKKNTLPPTVTTSVTNVTTTSCKIKSTSNYYGKNWQYSLNNGSTWTTFPSSTSGVYSVEDTITGLSTNTTYNIKTRCTRTYNDIQGTSATVTIKTEGGSVLNSVNTVTADDATVSVTFNWSVISGASITHTLRIKNPGGTTLVTVTGITGSTGSKTVTLTNAQKISLLSNIPNATSFVGTFELLTYSSGSQIGGVSSKTATVRTVEANSKPTWTDWSWSDDNYDVAMNSSDPIKTISDIQITCNSATAVNGSSISQYGITMGGKTVTSSTRFIDYGVCPTCGENLTWTVWVEDSRGYRTTIVKYQTVWCYEKPEILEYDAQREDSVGMKTGLSVLLTIRTTQGNNLNQFQYRVRKVGTSWPGSWSTISTGSFTYIGAVTPGRGGYTYSNNNWQTLASDSAYEVQIRARDKFQEYSNITTFSVRRGTPLMAFRDGKIGINQPNPRAALDIIDENVEGFYLNDFILRGGVHSFGTNANGRYVTFTSGITIQVFTKEMNQNDFKVLNSASGLSAVTLRSQLNNFNFPIAVNTTFHNGFSVGGSNVIALRSRPLTAKFGYGTTTRLSTSQWQNLTFWHWDTFGSTFTVFLNLFTVGFRNVAGS